MPAWACAIRRWSNWRRPSTNDSRSKRLGILVGGGPAPGINAVISAATIEALNQGFEVIGIRDGFKHLVRRDPSALRPLAIDDVSRVHLLGGSMLGTSRENPTKSPEATRAVIETLQQAGVTHLVTIGGDDTALSSRYVSEHSTGAIRSRARAEDDRQRSAAATARAHVRLSRPRGTSASSWCET